MSDTLENDYFAAQAPLVERLRAYLPAGIPVRTAADFEAVKNQSAGRREVWVFFHSDAVRDTSGARVLVEQRWAVMLISPTTLPSPSTDGQAIAAITRAVADYDPNLPGLGSFQRVGSLVPLSFKSDNLTAYGVLVAITVDV